MLLAAAIKTQITQESVFALGNILMILITLEVAVLKTQTAQELAALAQSHVMVREPAAVVTAEYVHVTADLLEIVATLQLVLEPVEKYAVAMETVSRALLWNASVKLDSTEMTVQTCNVLLMALAQVKVSAMSQMEPVFVIPDLKEICVKTCNVLAMELAQIMVPVMAQLEPVFVILYFKETCAKI